MGGSFISPEVGTHATWLGWLAGASLLVYALCIFVPAFRRDHAHQRSDVEDQVVQEIVVTDARVVQLHPLGSIAPVFAFDIGDGKILFLQGQWLAYPWIYAAPDEDEEFLNGLPAPYSFPSDAFTITRLPHSGELVSTIQVQGAYLPPEQTVDALKKGYEYNVTELFDGSLNDIENVLAADHAGRKGGE